MALEYGSDLKGFDFMRSIGKQPKYALKWIGDWTLNALRADGTSSEIDGFLNSCKTRGATPLILYYYWGDFNTDRDLTYGRDGRTTPEWEKLADILGAAFARLGIEGVVVVENEFNKDGCTPAVWDPALAGIMNRIKTKSGGRVKIATGLGSWADPATYDKYPKMLAATDILGTQLMRGSTKDSAAKYDASAEYITSWLERVHARYPSKDQIVFDTTFSTYGPYGTTRGTSDTSNPPEWSTEEPRAAAQTRGIKDREARLVTARVLAFIFREPSDNRARTPSKNYYGNAESYMGWAYRSDGSTKTAVLDAMKYLMTPSSSPAPQPEPSPTPMSKINVKTSNQYWLEITAPATTLGVTMAKNSGAPEAMPKTAYGSWGGKTSLAGVTRLDFVATDQNGSKTTATFSVNGTFQLTLVNETTTPAPTPTPTPTPAPETVPKADYDRAMSDLAAMTQKYETAMASLATRTQELTAATNKINAALAALS